jgi:Kdo2-lipid IVA lauroyltransferase/acyltransferase
MKERTGPLARIEYIAIRTAGFIMQMFPINVNLWTAKRIGDFWRIIDRRHAERCRVHIRAAYANELSEAEVDRITKECFRHWAMFATEFLAALRLVNEWSILKYVEPVGLQELFDVLLDKKGVILITGHHGNFELTAFTMAAIGFETVAIMRPLDNVYLNDYVVRTRASRGLRLMSKAGATDEVMGILQRGGTIGFVADQDAGRKGVFVNFFNQQASTYKSIALLAMHARVPIAIGGARRTGDRFHYECVIDRIIHPHEWDDKPDPLKWITQAYASSIESLVRKSPEQYLWLHRRWKSQPRKRSK